MIRPDEKYEAASFQNTPIEALIRKMRVLRRAKSWQPSKHSIGNTNPFIK